MYHIAVLPLPGVDLWGRHAVGPQRAAASAAARPGVPDERLDGLQA